IKKLYGSAIIREHYAPGPDDEGVDGEFLIEDAVGFREQVMMQAKTKKNDKPSISMKILREYVGVMHIRNADKCIIISNSSITKDAREAAKRLINVMLIGDKELFELMKKTRFGITVEAGIEKIDLPALIDLIRVK
ncbi:MAG: restriction endonuclease, partial [Bacillota bacterium]|nr:restriction endonuclease [Bacillota bacterium]